MKVSLLPLAVFLTLVLSGCRDRASDRMVYQAAKDVRLAALAIAMESDGTPKTIPVFDSVKKHGELPHRWKEQGAAVDPWGNPYLCEQDNTEVRVWSKGPDGIADTDDDITTHIPIAGRSEE